MSEFPERYDTRTPMPKVKPPAASRAISREKLRSFLKTQSNAWHIAAARHPTTEGRERCELRAVEFDYVLARLDQGEFDL